MHRRLLERQILRLLQMESKAYQLNLQTKHLSRLNGECRSLNEVFESQ